MQEALHHQEGKDGHCAAFHSRQHQRKGHHAHRTIRPIHDLQQLLCVHIVQPQQNILDQSPADHTSQQENQTPGPEGTCTDSGRTGICG